MKANSRLKGFANSPLLAHALIGSIFIALGLFVVFAGLTPSHDGIAGHGPSHYFYDSIARGVFPFWNPYSQTGTPFYPYFQEFGLWEPSSYLFILLQKITNCTTLTTYLLHYFFYYFLFIAGAYNTLRIVNQRNDVSLLFSLVLLLSTFPNFMHQPGELIPFYLVPFITCLLFKLFDEADIGKKGLYLFGVVSLCAVACLNYIPSYMVFYLLVFMALAFAMKLARVPDMLRLFKSKRGLAWVGASAAAAVLILAPVFALYFDFKINNELFPFVRVELRAEEHLVKMFATDIGPDFFSKMTTSPVSVASGNILGLLLEPNLWIPGMQMRLAQISLYIGILPLFCAIFFLWNMLEIRNKRAWLIAAMAGITALIMWNPNVDSPTGLFQRLLIWVIPSLDKIEAFEFFGTPFLFCLIITASVGFIRIMEDESRTIWLAALILWAAKYFWVLPWVTSALRKLSLLKSYSFWAGLLFYFLPLGTWRFPLARNLLFLWLPAGTTCCLLWINRKMPARRAFDRWLRFISVALVFADLAYFDLFHIARKDDDNGGWVLGKNYYATLMRENILHAKHEDSFINYREPYAESKIYTFEDHEILAAKKVALPAFFNCFFGGFPIKGEVFSTQSYYDYLVNVDLVKQLAASSIIYPILNFFPAEKAIVVPGEREAVAALNRLDLPALGKYIFIERASGEPAYSPASRDPSLLFSPKNYLKPDKKELAVFNRLKSLKFTGYRGFEPRIEHFDSNSLSVAVKAPEDGYFYFGDGYSKHWKAFVDGRPAKIEKTNVNFKSVFMAQGNHHIDFIYDPVWIRYAIYANIAGSLLAAVLALFFICRRRI